METIFNPFGRIGPAKFRNTAIILIAVGAASLIYLALILLVITFVTNLTAQRIVKRFELQRTGAA